MKLLAVLTPWLARAQVLAPLSDSAGEGAAGPHEQAAGLAQPARADEPTQPRWAWSGPAARRGALGILDQAALSIASFATVVLLGRCASQHELGLYSLALTPLLLLTNVQAEMITAPYAVYRQRCAADKLALYNGSILLHQLGCAVFSSCLLFGFFLLLRLGPWGSDLAAPVGILCLAAPWWMMRAFLRYVSFANLCFGWAVLLDGLAVALQLAGIFVCLSWLGLTAARTFLILGLSSAVACGVWWSVQRVGSFRIRRDQVIPDWRRNWCLARWALASQLIGCSSPYILPWVLAHTHGEAAAGRFAACVNLCGIAMLFVVGVAHSLTPQAARTYIHGGRAALEQLLTRTLLFFALTVGVFVAAAALLGEQIMTAVYGPHFAGMGLPIALLSAAVLATSFAVASGNGLWALERPQANLIADVIALLVTVAAALMLVGRTAVLGAALATLCGNTAGAITRMLILRFVLVRLDPLPRLRTQSV